MSPRDPAHNIVITFLFPLSLSNSLLYYIIIASCSDIVNRQYAGLCRILKEIVCRSNPKSLPREIIVQGSGKHFDSAVVEAFLEYEQEFDKVFTSLDV